MLQVQFLLPRLIRSRKIRHLNEQDLQTLLQSDENYYNSKRAITQSFQNFLRILIVALLGAFIAQTPWSSLNFPILAYIGTGSLIIAAILNIFACSRQACTPNVIRRISNCVYTKHTMKIILFTLMKYPDHIKWVMKY